jgi:hypothetical protein
MFAYGGKLYGVRDGAIESFKTGVSKLLVIDYQHIVTVDAKKLVLARIDNTQLTIINKIPTPLSNLIRLDNCTILGTTSSDRLVQVKLPELTGTPVNELDVRQVTRQGSTLLMIDLNKRLWTQQLGSEPVMTPIINVEKVLSNGRDILMLINQNHNLVARMWDITSQQLQPLVNLPMADIGQCQGRLLALDIDGIIRELINGDLKLLSLKCLVRVMLEVQDKMVIINNSGDFRLLFFDETGKLENRSLTYQLA